MDTDKIKEALGYCTKQAEELLTDKEKTMAFLDGLEDKLKDFANLQTLMDQIKVLIRMMRDFVTRKYQDVPVASIACLLGGLLYMFNKKDVIPDTVPVLGQLDDAAVLVLCIRLCGSDIEKYQAWADAQDGLDTVEDQVIADTD